MYFCKKLKNSLPHNLLFRQVLFTGTNQNKTELHNFFQENHLPFAFSFFRLFTYSIVRMVSTIEDEGQAILLM